MSIPDIPGVAELLASLTLIAPSSAEGYERLEVVPAKLSTAFGKPVKTGPLVAWRRTSTLSTEALLERVSKELRQHGHYSSAQMARVMLGTLCLAGKASPPSIAGLNWLVGQVEAGHSSQFLISPFPSHPTIQPFQVGRFTLGPLHRERLERRCRKVGCDFFDRYPGQFASEFAIESAPGSTRALDWVSVVEHLGIDPTAMFSVLVDHYFELLSIESRRIFTVDLMAAQEVLVAAGSPYIDLNAPWSWSGGSFVCVFQNIGRSRFGYFCPMSNVVEIDFAQADRRIPAKALELKEKFGFEGLDEVEIHDSLATYCRFVTRARIHFDQSRLGGQLKTGN